MLSAVRTANRAITYVEAEGEERVVSYAELYQRALGILHHLQRLGARPGDKLILFLAQNEPFIDAFWAAILGGIVPVPVAIGISDEHRRKLLRIARQLGQPYIYSDRKTLDRIGSFASQAGESATWAALRDRAFLSNELQDVGTAGQPYRARPDEIAFIQFSSGSTSDPKGVVLTHANVVANWQGPTMSRCRGCR
jgi:acyl-CoA synthetase (AMP-forming)/AMP-acid ligase II